MAVSSKTSLPACLPARILFLQWVSSVLACCIHIQVCSCTPTETQEKAIAEKQDFLQDGPFPLKCGRWMISLNGRRKPIEGVSRLEKTPSPVLSSGVNFKAHLSLGNVHWLPSIHTAYTWTFYSVELLATLMKFLVYSWCHQFFVFRPKFLRGFCNTEHITHWTVIWFQAKSDSGFSTTSIIPASFQQIFYIFTLDTYFFCFIIELLSTVRVFLFFFLLLLFLTFYLCFPSS